MADLDQRAKTVNDVRPVASPTEAVEPAARSSARRRHVDPRVAPTLSTPDSSSGSSPTSSARPTSTITFGLVASRTARRASFVAATDGARPASRSRPRPAPGQTQETDRRLGPAFTGGRAVFTPYARRGHAGQPVHLPGDRAGQRHRPAGRDRAVRARPAASLVVGGHGPPVHDAAAPPDRGVARSGRGRPDAARAAGRGPRRLVRAGRARRPVQRDGRPAPGERRDHPPRPRPEPRLPGRRLARAADAAGRPADVQRAARRRAPPTTPRHAPSSSSRAASRSSGSTGWPRTCSSSRSSIPGWSCSTCGRTTCARRSRSAVEQSARRGRASRRRLSLHLPDAPIRIRHDPQRIGQVVANLVANAVKFTPRGGSVAVDVARDARRGADRGRRHRRRHRCRRAAAHLRALLPRLAGERGARAAGAGSGWPSSARSSTCTAARSRSRAGSASGRGSSSTLPRDPRLVEGTPAAERAAVASAADARERTRRRARAFEPRRIGNVQETSPSDRPQVNPEPAP